MPHALTPPHLNRLLAGLPKADRDFLAGAMRRERPSVGRTLASHGVESRDIWFPNDAVVALSTTDDEGRTAQTGVVGPEGCVGFEVLVDDAPPSADASVQIEGDLTAIPAATLRSAIRNRPAIRSALTSYLYSLSAQTLRLVACNRLHKLDRRCCTWLLVMQDRTKSAELPLTQEGLATILGGGRPRVNRTLGALERAGLVRRRRATITLVSRGGLEERACDCYRSVFKPAMSR